MNIIIKNIVGFRESPIFAAPKLKSSRPKRLKQTKIALCTVVAAETPTRYLLRPRTPKQGAFILNSKDMTALQAIQQAQQTGQIAITKQTANMLEAVARLQEAAENYVSATEDNLPCEMSDTDTCNTLLDDFYEHFNPVTDYVFSTVGGIMLKRVFLFQQTDNFNGL